VDFGTSLSRWSRRLALRILGMKEKRSILLHLLLNRENRMDIFTLMRERSSPTGLTAPTESEVASPVGRIPSYSSTMDFVYNLKGPEAFASGPFCFSFVQLQRLCDKERRFAGLP
jgi:hypothetical protein